MNLNFPSLSIPAVTGLVQAITVSSAGSVSSNAKGVIGVPWGPISGSSTVQSSFAGDDSPVD